MMSSRISFSLMRPARKKKLPVILSRGEVITIMEHVKFFRYRVCLETIYSQELRLQEGIRVQICDIDSAVQCANNPYFVIALFQ